MKVLVYEYERMKRAGALLNSIAVSGTQNIRALAELADILDSGEVGETADKSKKEESKRRDNNWQ